METPERKEGSRHMRGDRKQRKSKRKIIELIRYRNKSGEFRSDKLGLNKQESENINETEKERNTAGYIHGQKKEK